MRVGDYSAVAQGDFSGAEVGKALFVGHQKNRVSLMVELQQQLQYFKGGCFVQISRWLICKEYGGAVYLSRET